MKNLLLFVLLISILSCGDKESSVGVGDSKKIDTSYVLAIFPTYTMDEISPYNQAMKIKYYSDTRYTVNSVGTIIDSQKLDKPVLDSMHRIPMVSYIDTTNGRNIGYLDSTDKAIQSPPVKGMSWYPMPNKLVVNTWSIGVDSAINYLKPFIKPKN